MFFLCAYVLLIFLNPTDNKGDFQTKMTDWNDCADTHVEVVHFDSDPQDYSKKNKERTRSKESFGFYGGTVFPVTSFEEISNKENFDKYETTRMYLFNSNLKSIHVLGGCEITHGRAEYMECKECQEFAKNKQSINSIYVRALKRVLPPLYLKSTNLTDAVLGETISHSYCLSMSMMKIVPIDKDSKPVENGHKFQACKSVVLTNDLREMYVFTPFKHGNTSIWMHFVASHNRFELDKNKETEIPNKAWKFSRFCTVGQIADDCQNEIKPEMFSMVSYPAPKTVIGDSFARHPHLSSLLDKKEEFKTKTTAEQKLILLNAILKMAQDAQQQCPGLFTPAPYKMVVLNNQKRVPKVGYYLKKIQWLRVLFLKVQVEGKELVAVFAPTVLESVQKNVLIDVISVEKAASFVHMGFVPVSY